jgi:hypothetical protein
MDIQQMIRLEQTPTTYSLHQLNQGASDMRFAMRKLSHLPAMDRERLGEYLDVVCQEVVVIETCSADGRLLVETGVRPVPVVLVGPGWE